MQMPLVSCLTATHGRGEVLQEALSCFLSQDYAPRELIILNNDAPPMELDPSLLLPADVYVKVLNGERHSTLGACRNRLLEVAQGAFVRTWDDDDLYLPWTLSQGVECIGSAPAFKPTRSWHSRRNTYFQLFDNVFEAAMLVRVEVARRYGYQESGGDEHLPLLAGIDKEGGCKKEEMGWKASYVYRWDSPVWRISGTLGQGTVEERTSDWLSMNADFKSVLKKVPLDGRWFELVAGAAPSLDGEDVVRLARELGVEI